MLISQVAVLVPAIGAAGRTGQLDEPHTALDEPPCDEALAPEGAGLFAVRLETVALPCRFAFPIDRHQFGHRRLHAEGGFVVCDGGLDGGIVAESCAAELVERAQCVELGALHAGAGLAGGNVGDRLAMRLKIDP